MGRPDKFFEHKSVVMELLAAIDGVSASKRLDMIERCAERAGISSRTIRRYMDRARADYLELVAENNKKDFFSAPEPVAGVCRECDGVATLQGPSPDVWHCEDCFDLNSARAASRHDVPVSKDRNLAAKMSVEKFIDALNGSDEDYG